MMRSPFKTFWTGLGSGVLRFIPTTSIRRMCWLLCRNRCLNCFESLSPTGMQGINPSLELFRHVQENHRFFQAMLRGHAGEALWGTGQVLLSRNIEQALTVACAETGSPSVPLAVVARYLAGTFGSLLKWWLEAEMPYPPEHMDRIFQQLAMPGVWATVEGKSD